MAPSVGSTASSSPGPSASDRRAKRARVLEILDRHGADSLVLRSHGAVSWYLDGVRTHVSLAGDPVVAVVVDRAGDEIRVFANEADRLADEELGAADRASVHEVPWFDQLAPAGVAALEESEVAADLRAARASLLPAERDRFRHLGRASAEAVGGVASVVEPGWTERQAAALLAERLVLQGVDPLVVLVAGAQRLRHRHPLPTGAPIGSRAMLVVCGRKHGLISNVTRWVSFAGIAASGATATDASASDAPAASTGDSTGESTDRERRILEVERAFLDATRPGTPIADVFAAGTAAYAAHGFDAEEWRRHHQGGAAGYVGRDPRALPGPGVDDLVQAGQAFAWNPTAPDAKVEDTIVRDVDGFEVLTVDPGWPTVQVGGLARPITLVR